MIDGSTFTCERYHLDMPADAADGFCAKRHRKATSSDFCFSCDRGYQLARSGESGALAKGWKRAHDFNLEQMKQKGEHMADKKKCSCGCGKNAVKDGLAYRCYSKKNGKKPFETHSSSVKKSGKKSVKPTSAPDKSSAQGNGSAPSDTRVLEVLIAAGFVRQEAVDSCRKLISISI